MPRSSKWPHPFRFPCQNWIRIPHPPLACYVICLTQMRPSPRISRRFAPLHHATRPSDGICLCNCNTPHTQVPGSNLDWTTTYRDWRPQSSVSTNERWGSTSKSATISSFNTQSYIAFVITFLLICYNIYSLNAVLRNMRIRAKCKQNTEDAGNNGWLQQADVTKHQLTVARHGRSWTSRTLEARFRFSAGATYVPGFRAVLFPVLAYTLRRAHLPYTKFSKYVRTHIAWINSVPLQARGLNQLKLNGNSNKNKQGTGKSCPWILLRTTLIKSMWGREGTTCESG